MSCAKPWAKCLTYIFLFNFHKQVLFFLYLFVPLSTTPPNTCSFFNSVHEIRCYTHHSTECFLPRITDGHYLDNGNSSLILLSAFVALSRSYDSRPFFFFLEAFYLLGSKKFSSHNFLSFVSFFLTSKYWIRIEIRPRISFLYDFSILL